MIQFDYKILLSKLITTIIIMICMYLMIKIGSAIINKFVEKQKKMKYSLDIKRAKTLGAVLKSVLRYGVYFFGVVSILTQYLGTTSLTFAGIGGVAIGFGAQNLVKDIINGFFILFEDHYAVGDYIEIEGKSGIVESVELRVTKLRGLNGDLHIVENGLISKVTNHSRGAVSMVVTIDINYSENVDKAIEIVEDVCSNYENEYIVDKPSINGISEFKENYYTLKIQGKTKPMHHWENENKLRLEIKNAFDRENIKIAHSKIEIVVKEVENGKEL